MSFFLSLPLCPSVERGREMILTEELQLLVQGQKVQGQQVQG
jgi:hypothetical protein